MRCPARKDRSRRLGASAHWTSSSEDRDRRRRRGGHQQRGDRVVALEAGGVGGERRRRVGGGAVAQVGDEGEDVGRPGVEQRREVDLARRGPAGPRPTARTPGRRRSASTSPRGRPALARGPVGDLLGEAGLADAGVALEQHDPALAAPPGGLRRRPDRRPLRGATDEPEAGRRFRGQVARVEGAVAAPARSSASRDRSAGDGSSPSSSAKRSCRSRKLASASPVRPAAWSARSSDARRPSRSGCDRTSCSSSGTSGGGRGGADGDPEREALLHGRQPVLLEPAGLGDGERFGGHVGEGSAPPEAERLAVGLIAAAASPAAAAVRASRPTARTGGRRWRRRRRRGGSAPASPVSVSSGWSTLRRFAA